MKKLLVLFTLSLTGLILTGCATAPNTTKTPLEIQALQTQEFSTTKHVAFNAVVSVFQDLGYTIDSANLNTGFITATSPTKNKTGFWDAMAQTTVNGKTKATAFISTAGPEKSKVRLNFVVVSNSSSRYGQNNENDTPILDPKAYQSAFSKIGNAIFVQGGGQSAPSNASAQSGNNGANP